MTTASLLTQLLGRRARADQAAADIANGLCPARHQPTRWACELPHGHPGQHIASRLRLRGAVPGTSQHGAHDVATW